MVGVGEAEIIKRGRGRGRGSRGRGRGRVRGGSRGRQKRVIEEVEEQIESSETVDNVIDLPIEDRRSAASPNSCETEDTVALAKPMKLLKMEDSDPGAGISKSVQDFEKNAKDMESESEKRMKQLTEIETELNNEIESIVKGKLKRNFMASFISHLKQPEIMDQFDWNFSRSKTSKAECIPSPNVHMCELCQLPILIYGRMIHCKHIFCLNCAEKHNSRCPRCEETVYRIEQAKLGSIFMCYHEGTHYGYDGCRRTYLSVRDLQAHFDHRHKPRLPSGGNSAEDSASSQESGQRTTFLRPNPPEQPGPSYTKGRSESGETTRPFSRPLQGNKETQDTWTRSYTPTPSMKGKEGSITHDRPHTRPHPTQNPHGREEMHQENRSYSPLHKNKDEEQNRPYSRLQTSPLGDRKFKEDGYEGGLYSSRPSPTQSSSPSKGREEDPRPITFPHSGQSSTGRIEMQDSRSQSRRHSTPVSQLQKSKEELLQLDPRINSRRHSSQVPQLRMKEEQDDHSLYRPHASNLKDLQGSPRLHYFKSARPPTATQFKPRE